MWFHNWLYRCIFGITVHIIGMAAAIRIIIIIPGVVRIVVRAINVIIPIAIPVIIVPVIKIIPAVTVPDLHPQVSVSIILIGVRVILLFFFLHVIIFFYLPDGRIIDIIRGLAGFVRGTATAKNSCRNYQE